jgi:Ala-tRNA(Pro) deacylase
MKLHKGRPDNEEGRLEKEIRVYDLLDSLGIEYYRIDHAPATGEDPGLMEEIERVLDARICNNLFLANRQRTEFCMMMIPSYKRFRSSDISKQAGRSRLHFAEPEYMEELIDCTPGSASVLALMNDAAGAVQLLIDETLLGEETLGCHPCVNTASLRIAMRDLREVVLPALHHTPKTVKL